MLKQRPLSIPDLKGLLFTLNLLALAVLVGCAGVNGSNHPGANNPPPGGTTPTLVDNWEFTGTPTTREIGAALRFTATTVTGSAQVLENSAASTCYVLDQVMSLSGTIDAQGNVSVHSSPVVGQVFTATGSLSADHSFISMGRYAFKGGCADGNIGSLTGTEFKPVSGNYAGILGSVSVSADLTQAPSIVIPSILTVAGTVTYSSPSCSEVFTVTTSQLAGRFIQLNLTAKDGTTTVVYGNINPAATELQLADYDSGCNGVGGVGILTKQ